MKKITRIVFNSIFITLSMTNMANAKIVLHSTIRDEPDTKTSVYPNNFSNENGDKSWIFPRNHYEYTIYGYDLVYDNKTPVKERTYNLKDLRANILVSLDLISDNRGKNVFKFRLTMKQTSLDYFGRALFQHFQQGGYIFDADVHCAGGEAASFILEAGIAKDKFGNRVLINSPNNKFFNLELATGADTDLAIKSNLPIVIIENIQGH